MTVNLKIVSVTVKVHALMMMAHRRKGFLKMVSTSASDTKHWSQKVKPDLLSFNVQKQHVIKKVNPYHRSQLM
jgi:hypothetical protein